MRTQCEVADCIWSDQSSFCTVLDNASVPLDHKWPLVILYLRGIKEASFLSEVQKSQMQELLLDVLKERDFTAKRYDLVQNRIYQIITANYSEKLQAIVKETSELSRDMQRMFGKHRDAVSNVAVKVEEDADSGMDPARLLARLRDELKGIAAKMTQDVEALSSLSHKDSLTGLANRRKFDAFLSEAVKNWQTKAEPISLILFDVDHFKQFNDTYGHLVGDQVLRTMAKQVTKILGPIADSANKVLAARYGGEEFAVILQGPVAERAAALAELIRKTVQKSALTVRDSDNNIVQSGLRVTISLGICAMQQGWGNALEENLLDFADRALYFAKHNGRNCCAVCEPANSPTFAVISED